MKIESIRFKIDDISNVKSKWYGKNWPVVYIIRNNLEAYIGETTNVNARMKQHMDNDDRRKLTKIDIIADNSFNKSAALDIESKLIEYMSSDQKYLIQNSNNGMRNHNYFQKEQYQQIFKNIWRELKKRDVVTHDLHHLENSDLFKYTPYKSLTEEQYEVVYNIAIDLIDSIYNGTPKSFMVSGEAGTGKTVLAMYLMKLLSDKNLLKFIYDDEDVSIEKFSEVQKYLDNIKIALVVPMVSLRKTLRQVVSKVSGLKSSMVIGPSDVVKDEYDLIIVDESHRLSRRVNLPNFGAFDKTNALLELGNEGTQLDWILQSSKYQIFFYDSSQSIRPSDVREKDFDDIVYIENANTYKVSSQLRSMGGNDYLKYIKEVFSNNPPEEKVTFDKFEFILFEKLEDMIERIKIKEEQHGLSRLVAGYAWEWKTKGKKPAEILKEDLFDIEIENQKLIWNSNNQGWINSKNAINEVGSIHTTQGYDLNYIGVIIGPEITFNIKTQKIEIIKENYRDRNGKRSIPNDLELQNYIINIYRIILSRAISGTYVYVCDINLKNFLSRYIDIQ